MLTENVSLVVALLYHINKDNPLMQLISYCFLQAGLRVVFAAYGFLYLKPSRDTLEGIQDFEFMQMVSNTQRTTAKYLP